MGKIFTVGETTYDIIFRNGQPTGAVVGGSVLNTSVSLGRLNLPVSFITRIGNDQIGDLSISFLKENGVESQYAVRFEGNSRLALAFMDANNNADYLFYKAQKSPDLIFPQIAANDYVVFGSTNAVKDEGRNSLLLFLNQAHDLNVLTFYDPNIREFGAVELVEVRRKFEDNLYLTRVLKGSTMDFLRLYDTSDADEIFERVKLFGVEVLIVTAGDQPISLRTVNLSKSYSFEPIIPISTIGAGDNFTAGLVFGFYKNGIASYDLQKIEESIWDEIIAYAASFSAEVCASDLNYISENFAKGML